MRSCNRLRTVKYYVFATPVIMLTVNSSCNHDQESKPNIIFILADDLGYGDLGCYGQQYIQTPRIDQMAREGIRFTQAYSGAPVSAPSRSVLMTGQHTGHTTVRENFGLIGGDDDEMGEKGHRIPLFEKDITIAEVLKKSGYATCVTGKWGLGENGSQGVPNLQGFDEWYGYLNQNHAVFYYTDYLWHNGQRDSIISNSKGKRQKYTHDLFTDFAMDFIRQHKTQPFFLYLPYTIPHLNMEVPELEPYTMNTGWSENAKIYASMITRMDRDVGKILDLLKELSLDKNTLVFFASDNGAAYTKESLNANIQFNSNADLKGTKGNLTEGGIRVPIIVRWPGKIPSGKVSQMPSYFADVFPTLVEITSSQNPGNLDGISILPTLLGKEQELDKRFMYWEQPYPKFAQAARCGNWKAIRKGGPGHPIYLYNLETDPHEESDVAINEPEIATMFENYLDTARTDSPFWPVETQK